MYKADEIKINFKIFHAANQHDLLSQAETLVLPLVQDGMVHAPTSQHTRLHNHLSI